MNRKVTVGGMLGVAVMVGACAGKSPPPAAPAKSTAAAAPKDDVMREITQGQLKVAHYASPDGTVGLVLDRSGSTPKVKIDGEKDVVELTMSEDRYAGSRRGWYLKTPTGSNLLYLSTHGGLKLYQKRDTVSLNSDRAAEPLPAPTVAGQYVAPKSAYDSTLEKLKTMTVLAKYPQYKPQDSGNLAKVAEAFATVPPELFVHASTSGAAKARWAPASAHIDNVNQGLGGAIGYGHTDEAWDKNKSGVAKYGGKLVSTLVEYPSPNRLRMHELKGWPPPLADKTPGLLWEMNDGTAVLVTVDGGRYEMSLESDGVAPIEAGAGPVASWPPPLQHTLIDVDSIRGLAKGGAVPAATGKAAEDADDGWFNCVNDVWKSTKTELDKAEAAPTSANDKWGRMQGIQKSAELRVPTKCAPSMKNLDAWLTSFIEARDKERLALYAKAQARFK